MGVLDHLDLPVLGERGRCAVPKSQQPLRSEVTRAKRLTKAQAERACRTAIRKRDEGRCRVCDKRSVHLHHLTKRSKGGTWATSNIIALCVHCHQSVHNGRLVVSGHADVSVYFEWLDAPRPDLKKPWGYSRPPSDPKGPGYRLSGITKTRQG